jgi:hypothetical protein
MSQNNNGQSSMHLFDNAFIELEVHYASEGSLKISINENGSKYDMHVCKIPPPFELSRYNGRMPKIESVNYSLELNKNLVTKLLTAMSEIKIPAIPEFNSGIDGSTYMLNINNGYNSSCYTWWNTPPRGYESLGRLVELLVEMSVRNGHINVK